MVEEVVCALATKTLEPIIVNDIAIISEKRIFEFNSAQLPLNYFYLEREPLKPFPFTKSMNIFPFVVMPNAL